MTTGLVVGLAMLGVGLCVFWIEPLGVLGVLERLTPNFIYRVRKEWIHLASLGCPVRRVP
jgi:hypothetical protein